MAKQCGQLRMLALDGNSSLTDKGVIALAENCPCLSELYLFGSDKVTQQAVQRVVVSGCLNDESFSGIKVTVMHNRSLP